MSRLYCSPGRSLKEFGYWGGGLKFGLLAENIACMLIIHKLSSQSNVLDSLDCLFYSFFLGDTPISMVIWRMPMYFITASGYGFYHCCSLIGGWRHMLAIVASLNGSTRSGTPGNELTEYPCGFLSPVNISSCSDACKICCWTPRVIISAPQQLVRCA